MAYTFPVLSAMPSVESWQEERAYNPTLRTEVDGGYVLTRPRTSRTPIPLKWQVKYNIMPIADKTALKAFEDIVQCGAAPFSWTNPNDDAEYSVRFLNPIKYTLYKTSLLWTVEFILEQV